MARAAPTVRSATLADYPALCALWLQLDALHARVRPDYFRVAAAPRPRRYLEEALASPGGTFLVAEIEGRVAGVVEVKVHDTPEDPLFAARRRAHVEDLVVDHARRRCGIGRLLMDAAVVWARGRAATDLVLTVWAGNEEAEAFYRRLGYEPLCHVLGGTLAGGSAKR
jgi:diamine N-acetyltransferase